MLCGSGYLDGSEIRESVGLLWSLSDANADIHCFAPDAKQHHVVNHLSQSESENESRNILEESARIARSQVKPLSELDSSSFDGIAIPGGFGVAKNLCTFAFDGSEAKIQYEVDTILQKFHRESKPILALCIAPALVALSIRDVSLELTLGAEGEAAEELKKLNHSHIARSASEYHADQTNKVFTSPAYMYDDASLKDIFTGISLATNAFIQAC